MSAGAGESVSCVGFSSEPAALQHHKGRRVVSVLRCSYGAARLQTETVQDKDASITYWHADSALMLSYDQHGEIWFIGVMISTVDLVIFCRS